MTRARSLRRGARRPNPALFALSAIALMAFAGAASAYELHLNCGGPNYTSQGGTFFAADRAYVSGNAGYMDQPSFTTDWQVVGGTPDQDLYRSIRYGGAGANALNEYRFDVPNGNYLVKLQFNEIFKHSTGESQFDVRIEGQEKISNLDVYALVQRTYALDFNLPVTVNDGQLNVVFNRDFGTVSIAAISVITRAPDAVAPAAPTGVTATPNYLAVGVDWNDSPEDDIAYYTVERSASPGGPFSPVGNGIEHVSRLLDPVAPGAPWYYRVRAIDAFGNGSSPSTVRDATALDHSATTLPIVEVLINPDSLEVLNDNPTSDDYVTCQVAFDGQLFPDAKCRYRGNVSRSLLKKSWKVKLGTGLFAGRDNFNVNGEYIDKSMMRTRLSYELLARNDVPTPRGRSVHMVVNDQWMGVSNDVEDVDAQFLERVGLDVDNSNVYKPIGLFLPNGHNSNLVVLDNLQEYKDLYEKEMGDPNDYSDLIAFIEGLNLTRPDSAFNYVAGHVDLNRFIDFYATESVLSNSDLTFKNWFLHHDLDHDRWTLIPFDRDLTFGNTIVFGEGVTTNYSMFVGTGNRLFIHAQTVPVFRQLFFDRIRQIFATTFSPAAMDGLIDSTYASIETDGERDWWKWGWEKNDWFHNGPSEIASYVTGRTSYLTSLIAASETPSPMVINEIQASNSTTVQDEWGDYDDWVELMNRSNQPVSLLGLYLTDHLTLPGMFALPDTTLPPGGKLVIWCDNEPQEGPRHAPFVLDVGDEEVGIFSGPLATSTALDVRDYDRQYTDASYGRLPDGSPYWQILPTPTPGTANVGGGNIRPQIRNVANFPGAPPANSPILITANISDDGTLSATQVHYDAGAGFVTQSMRDDGQTGDGAAGDGLFGSLLPGQPAQTTVLYYVSAQDNLGAVTVDPPGAPTTTYTFTTGYVSPDLKLNEFMADNVATIPDEHGDYDDWVEIWNGGTTTLQLGGMHLTDNLMNATKWTFPTWSLPPGQFLIVWCDAKPTEGPLHTTFKLSATGEELGLFDTIATGVGLIDSTTFGLQTTDVSRGRYPEGGPWYVMSTPTPGAANAGPVGIGEDGSGNLAPRVLALRGPFPNPFQRNAVFDLDLPSAAPVRLLVYDVQGRRVRALLDQSLNPGRYRPTWDGRDDRGQRVASGVYWLRLDTGREHRQVRAVHLR